MNNTKLLEDLKRARAALADSVAATCYSAREFSGDFGDRIALDKIDAQIAELEREQETKP